MCSPSSLSPEVRRLIASHAACPGRPTASPFGEKDEIGMLNLVRPSGIAWMLERADLGRIYDLAVDYFIGMPVWTAAGDMPFQIWMNHTPSGTVVDDATGAGRSQNELASYSGDSVAMYTHTGTHVDALCHWGYRGVIWNGFSERECLGSRHWLVAGADKHPPLVARGVLLDVAAAQGTEILPDSFGIGRRELEDAIAREGVEIGCGDVVLIRTGRMRVWPDPERYLGNSPGITLDGARFLAEQGVALIGADNIALEQIPPSSGSSWSPVHTYLLAEAGVTILEVANLEEIAADDVFEFVFVGACIKLRGATGAPIRPIAIALR